MFSCPRILQTVERTTRKENEMAIHNIDDKTRTIAGDIVSKIQKERDGIKFS